MEIVLKVRENCGGFYYFVPTEYVEEWDDYNGRLYNHAGTYLGMKCKSGDWVQSGRPLKRVPKCMMRSMKVGE